MRSFLLASSALVLFISGQVIAADKVDLARAEEIVSGRCFLCHGLEGESASPIFPRLAGQHSEYIAKQLGEFKSGKRKSDTMKPQAEDLTPAEMKALGAFFEGKKPSARPVRDADLVAVGKAQLLLPHQMLVAGKERRVSLLDQQLAELVAV